jgi:tetratricopeptide (TPR) repeat protein
MLALVGTLYRLGDFQAASDWCRRALSDAERIDHRSGLAHGAFLMIIINLALGHDDGRDYGAEALQIYEDLGDLVGQGKVWNNLGMAAYYRGDWNSTVEAWERSRDTQTRAGDAAGAATSVNNLGEVFSDRGDLDRAEEMFRDALRAYEAAGFPTGVALATANLARVDARRGRRQSAVELLEKAKTMFTELGAQAFVIETQLRIAEAYAFGGAFEEAQSALAEIPSSSGVPGLVAGIDRLRGVAAWHSGDRAAAESFLTSSMASAAEAAIPYERALSQDLLATLTGDAEARRESAGTLEQLGAASAARLPVPGDTGSTSPSQSIG